MKATFLCVAMWLLIAVPCEAGWFSRTHTAALMIGQSQEDVLRQAEHVLGEPIKTDNMSGGPRGEIHLRSYSYTDKWNIVLVFYQDTFYQLFVEDVVPDDMPYIGDVSGTLRGYILAQKDGKIDLQMIGAPGVQPTSNMLTTTSLDVAWSLFHDDDYAKAKQLASKVAEAYPSNARAFNLLGLIDLREGQLESGIQKIREAVQILEEQEKRRDYVLVNLGMAYVKAAQWEKAQQAFDKSIAAADDLNCAGRIGNFLSLLSMDRHDEALTIVAPCEDMERIRKALNDLLNFFEIENPSLKERALALLTK